MAAPDEWRRATHVADTTERAAPGRPAEIDEHRPRVPRTTPVVEAERVDAVAVDPFARRRAVVHKLMQAINLIFGIVEALIALRFTLKAFGANPASAFADFVYGVTAPLVAPFVGLFATPTFGASVIELNSIMALIVYALLAWVIGKLIWILFGETRHAIRTTATSVDTDVP